MNTYVEINGAKYPAVITGRLNDRDWDGRETKAIQMEMTYADVIALFVNDCAWSIVQEHMVHRNEVDENGNVNFVEKIEEVGYFRHLAPMLDRLAYLLCKEKIDAGEIKTLKEHVAELRKLRIDLEKICDFGGKGV